MPARRRPLPKFSIAPQLRHFVDQSGRSTEEVSEALGVEPQTLRNWLAGRAFPHVNHIAFICRVLGIAPKVLFQPVKVAKGVD